MSFDWGRAFQGGVTGAGLGSKVGGPWGAAIGGGIGALGGGLFNNGNDKDIDKWLDQIPNEMKQYLLPYIDAGKSALGRAGGQYDRLLSDPNAFIDALGQGYQQSPGYKFKLEQGENAINNAQAAGGMTGTGQHQQLAGDLAENLANQDFYNYLDHVLGAYGMGLNGEQGIANMGAGSAGDLSVSLANYLKGRAGVENNRQASGNQLFGDILSSIGSLF